jgi:hypothetical protein
MPTWMHPDLILEPLASNLQMRVVSSRVSAVGLPCPVEVKISGKTSVWSQRPIARSPVCAREKLQAFRAIAKGEGAVSKDCPDGTGRT